MADSSRLDPLHRWIFALAADLEWQVREDEFTMCPPIEGQDAVLSLLKSSAEL